MTKKIMLIDDEKDVLLSVREVLKEAEGKYDFIGVKSGNECLKMLNAGVIPDLILLDIMMPFLSGWEVYDRLRENPSWKNIPIVFLTARSDKTAEESGRFLGEGYIEKPFDAQTLLPVVEKVLS